MSKGRKTLDDIKQRTKTKKNINLQNIIIMKRTNLFAVIVCLFASTAICNAEDMPIPAAQLPAAAKTFVQQNFPGKTIAYAEKDTEFMKTKYEVSLNDGTQIDFDKAGNWDKVDCHMVAVPAALVPAAIQQYVNTNFAGTVVVKIDKERHGYDVELSNDIELKFNHQGVIIGFDD